MNNSGMMVLKYLRPCVLCFLLLVLYKRSNAQYIYQQIDNSSGLSNSCINSIYQDSDNLVWFGTWDGLNYYDSNNIHVYNYEKTGSRKSIESNVIYQILGDNYRNIWIGTVEGLSKFNKNTGDFSNYFYDRKKVSSNGYTIAIDNHQNVYAARRNSQELFSYNAKKDAFDKVIIRGLKDYMLIKMLFDEQGNLWLLKDNGILEAFLKSGNEFISLKQFKPVSEIDNVFFVNHHIYYATKNNELYRVTSGFDRQKLMILHHQIGSMDFFQHHYIFGWASKGIGEYDPNFRETAQISLQVPVLQNIRITSLNNDGANLLWVGTDGNGIIKISKKENYFGIVQKQKDGQIFHMPVRAFSDINNELWIGTKGNGIITMKDWGTRYVTYSTIKSFHTTVDLLDNCVYAIVKGREGLVYIGSDAPGVTLYDQRNKKFVKWEDIEGNKRFPVFGSVHCVLADKDSSVWLGLNDGGLVHLKLKQNAEDKIEIQYLYRYVYTNSDNGPGSNVIYTLAQGNDGMLWIGCRYGGLSLFDKKSKKFKTVKAFTYNGSLSNNDVLSLYIDRKNRLWVGTSFGLNWINEKEAATYSKPRFELFDTENGLPNNSIHAISEDKNGNIWISSNKGLAKIDPDNSKIVQYKESDGLQSDEFSDNAVWKDESGVLFFGGIYGFNYFSPENLHVDNEQPHLLLSDLQFAGRNTSEKGLNVLTKNGAVLNQHYVLKPQEDNFELTIQPITYLHAQKCRYAYFLEGNDKTWHYIGNHEKIIYNNIFPGNYILKIKWSNGEGGWTPAVAAFSITVKQFLWLTPAAFCIYSIMLFCSGYLFVRYRKNKFLLAQELRMEHVLREKDEKVHQEQLNFFTNIAHELQTPLTLILGSIERYLYKNTKEGEIHKNGHFLSIVKQESARLLYLIHQLLEFRKAESGQLQNHYNLQNVSGLLTGIASLFSPLVEQKEMDFNCQIEAGLNVWTDKDKLEKIVFNLLSNAFKHCDNKEFIIFSVHQLQHENRLQIVVANSGCKLTNDKIDRLFERFFVADEYQQSKISTGIGLAFTRQLVSLLGGDINVKCENNWISFTVFLPLSFNPQQKQELLEQLDKNDSPSYIFSTLNLLQKSVIHTTIAHNNKNSLIISFENENRKSILIVEDDQLIRYLIKDILTELYIVYEASSGKEAVEVISRAMPDLIISDIMMPDMNGLQLCDVIKNTTETCHIPFILLSARTTIQHMTEGYSCGADAYIPKPFQAEHLLVRIQKLLEYREKLHDLFNKGIVIAGNGELNESDRKFIEKVTRVIEANLTEELDGAFLENALNLSRIQLYRKIKTLSGMTPTELIRHIRLKKAAEFLRNFDLTVSEIFYRTGFNNKTYFFREFKKLFNCSPNDYRHQYRLPNLKT